MTKTKMLFAGAAMLTVAACGGLVPDPHFEYEAANLGPSAYLGTLALATPPGNQIVFGPCSDEFGMPDSRAGSCKLYYWLRGQTSPWERRKAVLAATAYKPGELVCWRTRGEVAECAVVSGPPHMPPSLAVPNTLGSE